MNNEKRSNGEVKLVTLAAVLIIISAMYANLYLCTRMLDTIDRLLVDYPVIVYAKDEAVEKIEEVVEKEAETIEQTEEIVEEVEEKTEEVKEAVQKTGVLTKSGGVNYFEGHKETYYNLPMKKVVSNAKNKGIEGDYWEREDGAKMLGEYVMIAADQKIHPYGSIVGTSLGDGIVVDTGTFIQTNPQQIDIATTW